MKFTIMPIKKYLILLEIEKSGYIIGITKNLPEAKALMKSVNKISDEYDINEMYRVASKVHYSSSYNIKGNLDYCGKSKYQISNGVLSIYILELDDTFSLKSFIQERINTSWAINPANNHEYEKFDELLELFPHFNAYAN